MINSKELRLGNYYLSFGVDLKQIERLTKDTNIIDLHPIPLTEEWLVKFGFEKAINGWWDESECFSIYEGVFRIGTDSIIKCEHVHQLQNLYFALTGKELTI